MLKRPMFTTKCPYCASAKVKKNGVRKGTQFYKCHSCGKQFYGNVQRLSSETIWEIYLEGKQTIAEIAQALHISESTVKRRLRQKVLEWQQPILTGKQGFVHVDATYWGHNLSSMRLRYHMSMLLQLLKPPDTSLKASL